VLMWRVIGLYFRCFFHFLFGKKTPESIAFRSLIQRHSYRIKAADQHNLTIGIRYFRMSMDLIWQQQRHPEFFDAKGTRAVFDGQIKSSKGRYQYIHGITHHEIRFVLAKNALGMHLSIGHQLSYSLALFFVSVFVLPFTLLHSHRGSIALNLLELVENALSLAHARQCGIRDVYYFNGYEKDANFATLLLRENGIGCIKIPSANPIKNFYRQTIADRFCFTVPFQKAEYKHLRPNWYVSETAEWPLYGYHKLLENVSKLGTPRPNTLGFISSGVWLREKKGDQNLGVGEMESENMLVQALSEYLVRRPQVTLTIYLHPIEKKTSELVSQSQDHYRAIFGPKAAFAPTDLPANEQFDLVDVAIAAHSSTNLERLFMGLKTLYAPLNYARDIFEDDPVSRVAAFDQKDLDQLIDRALIQNTDSFFEENELQHYRHDFYFPQS